jgi:hypothetical protein
MFKSTPKLARFFFFFFAILASLGCGGENKEGVTLKGPADVAQAIDADPLALLPGSPVVLVSVDAKAYFASGVVGAQVSQMMEKLIPIGEEAGFRASRDVDKAYVGVYALQGADVAGVLVGRFDEEKIKQAAQSRVQLRSGGVLVASQYAGRSLYTVSNLGFTILSPKTALVGTEVGMRRTLDRIHDGRVKRDAVQWMYQTLETPGASAAAAADFSSVPIPPQVVQIAQQFGLGWVGSVKVARALASFKDSGTQLAASFTFNDAAQAGTAAGQLRGAQGLTPLLQHILGLKITNMDVQTDQSDVKVSLMVDDQSLRMLAVNLPRWLGI